MMDIDQIKNHIGLFTGKSKRTRKAVKNIMLSFVAKGITIICALLIVPLTINYVNPTKYGIWLTLSSIIGWIGFFDLGLGNGFRNRFAEAKASGDLQLAKRYVATAYFTIALLMLGLLIIISFINSFVDWAKVLHVGTEYGSELTSVFFVLMFFFCLNMIVRLFTTILTADQKPGVSSIISAFGQVLSLFAIYILTKTTNGSLLYLSLYYSSIPTLLLLLCSIYAFCFTDYRYYRPKLAFADFSLVRNFMNLGIQFFIIYLCLIAIFQIINIVISRELGPDAVTEYNIAYKYYITLHNLFMIIVTPFWSAFTEAHVKKDISWMLKAKKGLEITWVGTIVVAIIMFVFSDWFYKVWIGSDIRIGEILTLAVAVYIVLMNIGGMYMNLINGIGTMRIQLIIYVGFALMAYPVLVFFIRNYGIVGVVVFPTIVVFIQALFAKIQIEKIVHGTAKGIWLK